MLPRKLSLQLTPLLDLLLIVIFAQYMEVQQQSVESEAKFSEQNQSVRKQLENAQTKLSKIESAHKQTLEELSRQEAAIDSLQSELSETQEENVELTQAWKQVVKQRETLGRLVAQLFNVPEELVRKVLKPQSRGEQIYSSEELAQLQQKFEELSDKRGQEVIRHLLTYEELRKRSDIWELHIHNDGRITLTTGKNSFTFRAKTPEEFEEKLFNRYKAMPQPKSLVIILLSYGGDTQFNWRRAALKGIPHAAERMRADSSGRTRFEYANLGFRPEGPQ